MSNDLVEAVRRCFTEQDISQLSTLVGETKSGVEKALDKAVPPVLGGLLYQAEHGTAPETLLHLARAADAAKVLTRLAPAPGFAGNERGSDLLRDLLGDAHRSTVNRIAEEAHIQPAASGTLLQTAATAALGVLGKFAVENELTSSEFVHWLQSQEAIGAATPPLAGLRGSQVPKEHLATAGPDPARPPALGPPRHAPPPARTAKPHQENGMALAATSATGSPGAERWQLGGLLLLAVSLGYFMGREEFDRTLRPAARPVAASPTTGPRTTNATNPAARPEVASPPAVVPSAPAPAATAPVVVSVAPRAAAPVPAPITAAPTPKTSKAAGKPAAATPTVAAPAAASLKTRPRNEQRTLAFRAASASAGRYDPARDVYVRDTGRPKVLTLTNGGGTENVGATSTEARLYGTLAAFTTQADSARRASAWIDFDRVYFEPGQTTLTPESMLQLTNVARILKTFPDVVVKIGAYTDSTGAGPEDLRFSEARARSVMTVLANQGVRLYRLFAQGYGAKYAVAPHTTPASRALNRRVSIRVLRRQL